MKHWSLHSRRSDVLAYAAPVVGSYFFYIPMWSILPGIYTKYFGLSLTSAATVVLSGRLFDAFSDLTVGYFSDRRRARGGSRKPWVIGGGVAAVVACYFLFIPPQPVTMTYYLIGSLAYFLAFAIAEIPHLTWGSELTLDYRKRAQVYGVRNAFAKIGIAGFYALPLLPFFASSEYTPQVLRVAVTAGAVVTVAALGWALLMAPAGYAVKSIVADSPRLLFQSIFCSKPLMMFLAAATCGALCSGMWYGLLYIYFDSYLGMGRQLASMLLLGTVVATLTTPLWLQLIGRTSKGTAWAVGVLLFIGQLLGTLCLRPGDPAWAAFLIVLTANLYFTANDIAAVSAMGDIIDYGKFKFCADRGATYFALVNLMGKIGLGLGGGLALGIAGRLGFSTADVVHNTASIWGLKLGFILLPMSFALVCLLFVLRMPINPRRHRIIQRRLESRLLRGAP